MKKNYLSAKTENENKGPELSELQKVYDCKLDVSALEFESRADHCLHRGGIFTIGELARNLDDIRKIRGCGENTELEIREKLQNFIDHYVPKTEEAASESKIRRKPIGHCIIMLGNVPKYLTCFGGHCFDMAKSMRTISLTGIEYNLGQYRIKVSAEGRPSLYINGEAMPAVLSMM